MVVISRPSTRAASERHAFTRLPSISTVQAPHWPRPQPFLRAGQVQVLAQGVEQRGARIERQPVLGPVDAEHHVERSGRRVGALRGRRRYGSRHELSSGQERRRSPRRAPAALVVSHRSWSSSELAELARKVSQGRWRPLTCRRESRPRRSCLSRAGRCARQTRSDQRWDGAKSEVTGEGGRARNDARPARAGSGADQGSIQTAANRSEPLCRKAENPRAWSPRSPSPVGAARCGPLPRMMI